MQEEEEEEDEDDIANDWPAGAAVWKEDPAPPATADAAVLVDYKAKKLVCAVRHQCVLQREYLCVLAASSVLTSLSLCIATGVPAACAPPHERIPPEW